MSIKKESLADVRLHAAAAGGDLQTLRCLLDSGKVHVDSRDKDGTTPLMLSGAGGHIQCCQELLQHGADPHARRQSGATALFFAAQGGFVYIVRLLLNHSSKDTVNIQSKDGGTPLIVAAQMGYPDVVHELLENGALPNLQMKDGASALFVASQNGHFKIVSQILEKSKLQLLDVVNQGRQDGATPLWIAAQMGHESIVRLLVKSGASVDVCRQDGISALSKACEKGHREVVIELLRFRAFLGLGQNGESPLHVAVRKGHFEIVEMLFGAGADPYLPDRRGRTPFQIAVQTKQDPILQLFNRRPRKNSTDSPSPLSTSSSPFPE